MTTTNTGRILRRVSVVIETKRSLAERFVAELIERDGDLSVRITDSVGKVMFTDWLWVPERDGQGLSTGRFVGLIKGCSDAHFVDNWEDATDYLCTRVMRAMGERDL